MSFAVEIILDSISRAGDRIITLTARYPKYIHPEVLHHRDFSRGAPSNRARSTWTIIKEVWKNPVVPERWGKNTSRMQPKGELSGWRRWLARQLWLKARYVAIGLALALNKLGVHKELANRPLEPWQWMTLLITATEWDNFFYLRCHPEAQGECRKIAEMIRDARAASVPVIRDEHLPYIQPHEQTWSSELRVQLSVGRCARISFLKQGSGSELDADLKLYDRLSGSQPEHSGPFEHQAWAPSIAAGVRYFNLKGWVSWRYLREVHGVTDEFLNLDRKKVA